MTETETAQAARWWPVATTAELAAANHFLSIRLFDQPWLIAALDGQLAAVRDQCPHRRVPLSAGRRVDTPAGQQLECGYHGWRFAGSGACSLVPALGPTADVPKGMRVATAQLTERYGVVWLATEPPEGPAPYLSGVRGDDATESETPQRWAMPATDLLIRIHRNIGGTLAADASSLQVQPPSPGDCGAARVTLVVQPETPATSRLFTLRHEPGQAYA